MYEADHIKSISDIPDNISNLLKELKEFKDSFNIEIKYCKGKYGITLRESMLNHELNTTRCILIEISENPCSYSVQLFNESLQESSKVEFKKNYEIEVEGENDFKIIKQDVKDLLEGKKGATFSSTYPL